jgi:hypothetical protein
VDGDKRPGAQRPSHRSEASLLIGWCVGLILTLVMGWGLIAVVAYVAYRWNVGISFNLAGLIASGVSLGLLLLLEQNLWLSRFMGLRLGPHSTPLKEALFLWFLGIPGLLFRSTGSPNAAQDGSETTGEAGASRSRPAPPPQTDSFREVVETIVFVVVLVLLLKSFLAEAFVIPTGSMATTLLGYHRQETCPQCQFRFPVNCSQEEEGPTRERLPVTHCTCPNCLFRIEIRPPQRLEGVIAP